MTVEDVLIGEKSVIVETDDERYKFDKTNEDSVEAPEDVPDEVEIALIDAGIEITDFPVQVKHYIHDEASPSDYKDISEELRMDEDADIVRRVANLGYEVIFTVRVEDKNTAFITHVDGHELKEPKEIH